MIRYSETRASRLLLPGGLFILTILYFGIFNRFHILYLEQEQLFLYNLYFLRENFSLPGGGASYAGSFFTQFFISSWAGAFIIALITLSVFLLSAHILKRHNIRNIIPAIIPVWLLIILQSNELFRFGNSVGFLLLLIYSGLYISFSKTVQRYIFHFSVWPVLYILIGGYAMPAVMFCSIHELLFRKQDYRKIISVLYIVAGVFIPYALSRLIYYIPAGEIYIYPIPLELNLSSIYALILLLVWFPLVLAAAYMLKKITPDKLKFTGWNLRNLLSATIIFVILVFGVFKYGYNHSTELMLGIDYYAQQGKWTKLLELSERFPGSNSLVICYTNLALYKSGKLLEKMFSYPQAGAEGLRLKKERSSGFFFGGEVFYYLSYTSETTRWAFETMIARGLNPRALKRLVTTSIINDDAEVAKKYLYILNQTLFYRDFTKKYVSYLNNPELADKDPDIARNRNLMIHSDFFSSENDLNLPDLLKNHPENKMAYEYLMASFLLDKQLEALAFYILRIKDYNYTKMPVHLEEALLFYNAFENKKIMPEGFSFSPETIKRFNDYMTKYNSLSANFKTAARELKKTYGDSYWYYLQFTKTN